MRTGSVNPDVRRAVRMLLIQLLLTGFMTGIAWFWGQMSALSALLGGGIACIGNALFAFWVFARYRAQDPGKLIMRLYGAELIKVTTVVGLFAAVFFWVEDIMPVVFLLAFFVSQVLPPLLAHGSGN